MPRVAKSKVLVVVAVVSLIGWLLCTKYCSPSADLGGYRLDLDVYRIGSRLWLTGRDIYGPIRAADGEMLPFLYPPLSAVIFAPLAIAPFWVAGVAVTVLSAAALVVVVAVVVRSLHGRALGNRQWLLVAALVPAMFLFEPVRSTFLFGQVNLVLLALVTADCLTPNPRWPRGVLLGVAAAIKLTPAAFVLFFLLRRDWRSTARAGLSFVACSAIGFLFDWHDSVNYWTRIAYQTNRIGLSSPINQSLTSALLRLGLPRSAWLVLVLFGTAVVGMWRALGSGNRVLALSINGVLELLASPISWTHHWVWVVPLVPGLLVAGPRTRRWIALPLAGLATVLFVLAPPWWPLSTMTWHQLAGSAYVVFGIVFLACAALVRSRSRTPVAQPADLSLALVAR
ncbi:MAG TPA: glycosyltransferase 87 family protein [Pseudonocardiaceae bacterium]|nr:glycosyltransferase 87 family protein [Pseudonocardiaceae bacterium]